MPRRTGPPPKPTNLRLIEGNPGKKQLDPTEPKPDAPKEKAVAALCPSWLSDEAKACWKRLAPRLRRMGLLTFVDVDALGAYCSAYAEYKEATLFLQKNGLVYNIKDKDGKPRYVQQWPQVSIRSNAMKVMRDFQQEFGLTPASRTRISMAPTGGVPPGRNEDDEESVAQRLLSS